LGGSGYAVQDAALNSMSYNIRHGRIREVVSSGCGPPPDPMPDNCSGSRTPVCLNHFHPDMLLPGD